MKRSILNSAEANALLKRIESLENQVGLLTNMVAGLHDVAVCDKCEEGHERWFIYSTDSYPVMCSANGLLIFDIACCVECLDKIYEESVGRDYDYIDELTDTMAWFFLRHRNVMNQTAFGKHPDVLNKMKRFAP